MIELLNIKKTYTSKERVSFFKNKKTTKTALNDISLSIPSGKIVGLIGINGAGKTTTIKILSGLLKVDSGRYLLDGMDGLKNYQKVKAKVNSISGGERNLYWRISAQQNLRYFGCLYGYYGKELNTRIDELLEFVGLSEYKFVPVEDYSKGMKQRLQFARGLINNPKYLFLDEPTLGLDINIASKLRSDIKSKVKSNNMGVLLTSHYMAEVQELCDYIYIIDSGNIVYESDIQQLRMSLSNKDRVTVSFNALDWLPDYFATNDIDVNYDNLSVTVEKKNVNDLIKLGIESGYKVSGYEEHVYDLESMILDISND